MITLTTPTMAQLAGIAETLGAWQTPEWVGFLHPGDLGWHSTAGAERVAADLRCWSDAGRVLAIGMFDGDGLLRLAMAPTALGDDDLARGIAADLAGDRLLPPGAATLEARGAHALRDHLRAAGWEPGDAWTALQLDLEAPIPEARAGVDLRIAEVGPDEAEAWAAVHWSAFRGTVPSAEELRKHVGRWTGIAAGPFGRLARHLIGYDRADAPVAATTVWSAGVGRTGLIEPLGVHSDHRGHGYGREMTLAGARALRRLGAATAGIAAEQANPGALNTYLAAGFRAGAPVADLTRAAAGA